MRWPASGGLPEDAGILTRGSGAIVGAVVPAGARLQGDDIAARVGDHQPGTVEVEGAGASGRGDEQA